MKSGIFQQRFYSLIKILVIGFALLASPVFAQEGGYLEGVYQIRVIDVQTGEKSSIGSGFSVDAKGALVTNYHVISSVANNPDAYYIEVIDTKNKHHTATLKNVDVVHDLALVQADIAPSFFFNLAAVEPKQGDEVIALGNPMDLGVMVVPGTWNGDVAHRFHRLINFSGALNPGMSGGPAVNNNNEVVGVNVAGYGNSLSLLVPLAFVKKIVEIDSYPDDLTEAITAQLFDDQSRRVDALLNGDWTVVELSGAKALSEITDFVNCWGASNSDEEDRQLDLASRSCGTNESIYLRSKLRTGDIKINSVVFENRSLTEDQFAYRVHRFMYLNGQIKQNKDHYGDFECDETFLSSKTSVKKGIFCVRAYGDYIGLYDVYLKIGTSPEDGKIAFNFISMTGVSEESTARVINKFLEVLL